MDSDDFENIQLPIPPDSDEDDILPLYSSHETDLMSIISPQKRQRTKYTNHTTQKRRKIAKSSPVKKSTSVHSSPSKTINELTHVVSETPFAEQQNNSSEPLEIQTEFSDDIEGEEDIQGYSNYCECVLSGTAGFYQLESDLFVVEGWDTKKHMVKSNVWYHLQKQRTTLGGGSKWSIVCFCPAFKLTETCVHQLFLADFGEQQFQSDRREGENHRPVIVFSWQKGENGRFEHYFSVSGESAKESVKARVIVHHIGNSDRTGSWRCSKDGKNVCGHIKRARLYLKDFIGSEKLIEERGGEPHIAQSLRGHNSVSHLAILPPAWVMLPSDELLYERASPIIIPPQSVPLDDGARCLCGSPPAAAGPKTFDNKCQIYCLTQSYEVNIELQPCPRKCSGGRTRYVGPDGRTLGLFNFNNQILFAHDLMDEYTAAYSSSETPFTAWISVVSRRYEQYKPGSSFVSEDTFRTAWFLYVTLQNFDADMKCPTCGPEPSVVIFDGVTLSFGKKHVTLSLCPPTVVHEDSVVKLTKYVKEQQALRNTKTRKLVRKVITGRSLILTESEMKANRNRDHAVGGGLDEESEEEGINAETPASRKKSLLDVIERIEAIPDARIALNEVNEDLGTLFGEYYSIERIQAKVQVPREYAIFLRELTAEESIIQMIPYPSLRQLHLFNINSTRQNMELLRCIPALYDVLKSEAHASASQNKSSCFSPTILRVCQWLEHRTTEVLAALRTERPPPCNVEQKRQEKSWIETGSFYNMPKIRHRPSYPNLKHDQNTDGGKRRAKCSKYYSQYGENRLTGGIMVCWCTHSIAYGFHCIPKGEGRNDVFSALLTHWKTPPEWVIYDFACTLGPYCMTREADFFKNTRFAIDDCHAQGHTKCGPSCFLKTYANYDASLGRINTSAAECGNGAIGRIRKSVSYMRQDRAIIYTRVFIAIWNRLKIRKMLE